jgi:NAD dependent epimerase/dehydratase
MIMSEIQKDILVTGADGFIGSHLTELLVKQGHKVKALSQYNSFNNWGWLEDIECRDSIDVLSGDIRDSHYCYSITKNVETIFHLAALIAIPHSYVAPYSYIDTNVKGTLNICQAALDNGVKRLIHTSTSEVYGTAKYVPIDEEHPLQPQSPYSASKIAADAIAMSFFNSFNLPVIIARPFNTYGPRQSSRAVIPTIITQIANGKRRIELGDISPTRDFTYVLDTCKGLLELASCDSAVGEVVNIGSNIEFSIGETLELIKELMCSDVEFIIDNERIRPAKSEVFRLLCNNAKLGNLTGFKPSIDIQSGLKLTIDWFTNNENLRRYKHNFYNT